MKKILIVEDDPELAFLLKRCLESGGYQVITACDGEEGFSKFITERPGLVILDLGLPKINGYEVARKIRKEREDKTPILMLTGKGEDADRIIGRVRGADKYMTKPFELEELLEQVKSLLKE
ncbi:MAG: response regulator [Candidatus Omnitrophica bacterium]|nr:response regulator [Candidatus Omnitrophota bacterium]